MQSTIRVPKALNRHTSVHTSPVVRFAAGRTAKLSNTSRVSAQTNDMASSTAVNEGGCSCGAVRFEVHGEPTLQAYCHCDDCQRISGHPVRASLVWINTDHFMADEVDTGSSNAPVLRVTKGSDCLTKFNRTPTTDRYFCKICGTPVFAYTRGPRATSTVPINLDNFTFRPSLHVNCTQAKRGSIAALMKDGLPKFKGFPSEAGGTGELIES